MRADRLRVASLLVGLLPLAWGFWGMRNPLASMASYTAALMTLNQIAPPFLLLALPTQSGRGALADMLFDPVAASVVFVGLSVAVSLPGIFDHSLVDALYTVPLGLLEFISGLMFWAQVMPATRRITRAWLAGVVGWLGSLPMMVVAVVWMLWPDVLYTPYLDVICRWDLPPIADQRWAGFVMFLAGMPLQLTAAWLTLGLDRSAMSESGDDARW